MDFEEQVHMIGIILEENRKISSATSSILLLSLLLSYIYYYWHFLWKETKFSRLHNTKLNKISLETVEVRWLPIGWKWKTSKLHVPLILQVLF